MHPDMHILTMARANLSATSHLSLNGAFWHATVQRMHVSWTHSCVLILFGLSLEKFTWHICLSVVTWRGTGVLFLLSETCVTYS